MLRGLLLLMGIAWPHADSRGHAAPPSLPPPLASLVQGIQLFNSKPRKGVAFLQEQGLVGPTPADVAQFLTRVGRLAERGVCEIAGLAPRLRANGGRCAPPPPPRADRGPEQDPGRRLPGRARGL